jgi:hypothetical protein
MIGKRIMFSMMTKATTIDQKKYNQLSGRTKGIIDGVEASEAGSSARACDIQRFADLRQRC